MFCENCGNEIKEGEKFCGKCGKSIEQGEVKNNVSSEKKTKNFIMQLKEGTDFLMSFNVQ